MPVIFPTSSSFDAGASNAAGVASATRVLIVGAGPTGLVLAINLARRGVPFRLIDAAQGPGEHSRAIVVQARTLEFYQQLGFANAVVAEGIVAQRIHFRESARDGRSRELIQLRFGEIGKGLSPYPFALIYPQDDHERFLEKRLAESGIRVEWSTTLTGLTQSETGVRATVRGPNGEEEIAAEYLCGCDGAHSEVRQALGLGFAGRTYEQPFFVCDCKVASGFETDLYANLGEDALALLFPVRLSGMQRLIGLVPPELSNAQDLTFDDIRGSIEPLIGKTVTEINWFAVYRVHHRVAERFRSGRAFILGDAAHIHSPAGGQGMNTGIGDAMNLGWKLADVLSNRASESILDSFNEERLGFARALVATTDRAFTAMVSPGMRGELLRRVVAPIGFLAATQLSITRAMFFRIVSQIQIRYPDSSLSEGQAGEVHGGDRLPWVESDDNFAPLRSLDWQLHVYGEPAADVSACCARLSVALAQFPWNRDAERAGFARDAGYLVRPDGYVALAFDADETSALEPYARRISLS
ncbi:MAG TPA: FAD-dependent monooxygenase [Candidatus Cybelea sp.]|jgi:2-polyprenyl-6-methoxyphenol hydroxylase-like FAD-dependent oxidoreductase